MPSAPSNTYQRLRQFIAQRMRMSHVYQPLMLMELLGRHSPAPAEDVARRILGEDITQIDYYTERVKRMVGRVLTGNGITRYEKGVYSLVGAEELSDTERDELLQLCRQRLDALRQHRGDDVFAHRSRHRTPISGSVKYRVLTRAKGRCECCGAHEHQRALEVDHIVPKNQGGSDDLSNLQALCFRCNAAKRDTDSTDFRGVQASYAKREQDCVFCAGRQWPGAAGERTGTVHRRCLPGDARPQPGDSSAACTRWAGATPAGVECGGGTTEKAARAAQRPVRLDQRLECRAELSRGGGAERVSCALASDPEASGGLHGASGRGAGREGLEVTPTSQALTQHPHSNIIHTNKSCCCMKEKNLSTILCPRRTRCASSNSGKQTSSAISAILLASLFLPRRCSPLYILFLSSKR